MGFHRGARTYAMHDFKHLKNSPRSINLINLERYFIRHTSMQRTYRHEPPSPTCIQLLRQSGATEEYVLDLRVERERGLDSLGQLPRAEVFTACGGAGERDVVAASCFFRSRSAGQRPCLRTSRREAGARTGQSAPSESINYIRPPIPGVHEVRGKLARKGVVKPRHTCEQYIAVEGSGGEEPLT